MYIYIYIYIYIYVCMYICIYMCIYVYVCACEWVWVGGWRSGRIKRALQRYVTFQFEIQPDSGT